MATTEAQRVVTVFLDQCAVQRAGDVTPAQDELVRLQRTVQAEEAGRQLLCFLVDPRYAAGLGVHEVLRRLIQFIQTVTSSSHRPTQTPPLITALVHHVVATEAQAQLLRDATVLLVLAAISDEARHIEVRLDTADGGIALVVESNRPWTVADQQALQRIRAVVEQDGGMWATRLAPTGASWLAEVRVPMGRANEVTYGS